MTTTANFIILQMFIEQSSKNKGGNFGASAFVPAPPQFTFASWQVGFFVASSRSESGEEFKITKITAKDGKMANDDCSVTLQNAAGETREVKGSTLRSSYKFVSVGDVVIEQPKLETVATPMRTDCMPLHVNIAGIREFYPRKSGEGTRIIMMDKTAYIVADPIASIELLVRKAGGYTGAGTFGG